MSLKDELLKAKLISKKDVQRIEHEGRVERKKLGSEAIKAKEEQRQKEIEEKIEAQRQHNKELAKQNQEKKENIRAEKEKIVNIQEMLKSSQMEERGTRKFYFIAKNNTIPSLCIGDNLSEKLEKGLAAITEFTTHEGPEFYIVNRQCAEKILEIDANIIRFFNR